MQVRSIDISLQARPVRIDSQHRAHAAWHADDPERSGSLLGYFPVLPARSRAHHVDLADQSYLRTTLGMNEFLTINDLRALLKIGRSTAYRLTQRPGFPDPVRLSGSCYRWPRLEVEAYLGSLSVPPSDRLKPVPAPGSRIVATRRQGQRRRQGAAK